MLTAAISKLRINIDSVILFIIPLILLVFPQLVYADGVMFGKDGYINEPSQEALILKSGRMETLYLRIQLEGDAKDLGWVLPLPSYPEVKECDKSLFYVLDQLTTPKERKGYKTAKAKESGIGAGIEVEQIKVGMYDVSKIKANDPNALFDWLNEHGFKQSESVKTILNEYINKHFSFIAVKINLEIWGNDERAELSQKPDRPHPEWHSIPIWLDPIRLDFESDEWFYPMKISSLNQGFTTLTLWTASDVMMDFGETKHDLDTGFPISPVEWADWMYPEKVDHYPVSSIWQDKFVTRLSWGMTNSDIEDDIILRENPNWSFKNKTIKYRFHNLWNHSVFWRTVFVILMVLATAFICFLICRFVYKVKKGEIDLNLIKKRINTIAKIFLICIIVLFVSCLFLPLLIPIVNMLIDLWERFWRFLSQLWS